MESRRRLGKATKRGKRSNRMPAHEDRSQLIDSAEMKQEPDIKEEPQLIGDLATVPAQSLDNRSKGQEFVDYMESDDDEEEHANCPFDDDDVKIEVKNECNVKEKKERVNEPESNVDDQDELNNQQYEHQSNADANNPQHNEAGTDARNVKNQTKGKGKASKLHKCTQCDYGTKYKWYLKKHLLKHTGEKPFACKHCSKAFTSKQGLQNHMKVHVKDFLFNCLVCLRGFDRKNEKTEHEGNCKALRYECHLCKTSFGSMKNNLIVHMRMHSGEGAFECKECSQQFTQKSNLNRHMKLHAGPRPLRCSKCLQVFAQQNERNEHESKCNRRTFECYVCGKAFGLDRGHLNEHMRTHTGDKPFSCAQCSKKFAQKSQLNEHQKVHSRSLPWKCAICRHGFPKQNQWKAHQRSCSRRVYECCWCKKFFGLYLRLKKHVTKCTGEKPFKCNVCQNRFTRKSNLMQHMRSIHK